MVFAWNRREVVIYDKDSEVEIVVSSSPIEMKALINTRLQEGWVLDPVLSRLTTVILGGTAKFGILMVRELPVP